MDIIKSIILGIIQGATEFIPVSSSGHLVIGRDILGIDEVGLVFDVILHIATLLAVFIYFFNDIKQLAIEFFSLTYQIVSYPFTKKNIHILDYSKPYRILLIMIITGTIPAAIIGYFFNDLFKMLFERVQIVGFTLFITGIMLWFANKIKDKPRPKRRIQFSDAIIIGIFQSMAITPGISRSGSTIFAGLLRGFNRELATKFSFLLSLPTIIGAAILESKDILSIATISIDTGILLSGFFAALISGYLAIKVLIRLINNQKLHYFSFYCWILGLLVIIYSI